MCKFCDKAFKQLHDKYIFHIVVKQRENYTTYIPVPNLNGVRFDIDDDKAHDGVGSTEHQTFEWKFCPVCGEKLSTEDNKQ